ncbi:MAG: ATP-binding protein [Acidobacteria bacterium]|nr:ATP-binding protein [Acidobacteriota bacterium]
MQDPNSSWMVLVDQRLESSLETVDSCEERAKTEAMRLGFAEEDAYEIGYAVREAVVNAVVHGNQYSANKQVGFGLAASGKTLRILVEDQGRGFHPDEQADPLASENLLNQSGRGIMIIRAFVDELRIEAAAQGGTRLVMLKTVGGETPGPDAVSNS